ncbi:MAG: HAD family hydrolase [Nitrospirae bacterium]|nr:MAG: HAD family hydrolase [Nitrospirota bacterium]
MNDPSFLVIFFDAAGTLFHVKGSVGEVYLRYAEKYGVTFTPERVALVNQAFQTAFREAPPPVFAVEHPEKLKQCERLWWFDIVHAVFYRVGMFERFDDYFDEIFEAFGGPDLWAVYPEVPDVLAHLKQEGYELGIISNFDTRLFGILRGLHLDQYFDSVTISTLAGSAKPAPPIFHYALAQHAADPPEAVHVGDSLHEDVEGATRARLHAILLDRNRAFASSRVPRVTTLRDLPDALNQLQLAPSLTR